MRGESDPNKVLGQIKGKTALFTNSGRSLLVDVVLACTDFVMARDSEGKVAIIPWPSIAMMVDASDQHEDEMPQDSS